MHGLLGAVVYLLVMFWWVLVKFGWSLLERGASCNLCLLSGFFVGCYFLKLTVVVMGVLAVAFYIVCF